MDKPAPARQYLQSSWNRIPPGLQLWLKRITYALLIVYAAYLLLGNLFINTPLGTWTANRKPDKFQIEWGPGLTWWPGHVVVWDVKMKGHAGRTVWSVNADKVSGHIAILPLLRKEVRVPEVWATGVSGEVDQVGPHKPPAQARPGGWTLVFERIATDTIRRGRFAGLKLEGTGSAEVGFYKQLRGGALELMPSKAHFNAARLGFGDNELLRDATIDARFAIARHTREQASGIRKLLMTDAELTLQGATAALRVQADADGKVAIATVPGQGKAQARLGFKRGALTPGSQLHWQIPVTGTTTTGATHAESLDIRLDVDRDVVFKAKVPPQHDGLLTLDTELHMSGRQVPLQGLDALLARTSGQVVGRWHFASLRWLGAFFSNAPWLSLDGAGSVDADVRLHNGKVAAGSHVGVPEVSAVVDVMGNRIQGRARADARLDAGQDGKLLPLLDLVMERFTVAADDARDRPFVEGQDLHLGVQSLSGFEQGQLRQPGALRQARNGVRAHLKFTDAQVPDLRAYNRYLPAAHMRFDGGAGRLSGDVTLDGAGDVGQGWLRVNGRDTRLHLAGLALRGDIDIDTQLRRASLDTHNFNIDGSSVDLRNISFTESDGESHSGWWAKINLDRARMDWDKPVAVNGSVHIAMKDVGFLLSMFSHQREYPKWIYKLIDSGQAKASGRVQWQGDKLVLDRLEASNQRYDLKARLELHGQNRVGSLYANWGVLSMAVQVDNGQRDFHLLHARKWYDAQPDLLR